MVEAGQSLTSKGMFQVTTAWQAFAEVLVTMFCGHELNVALPDSIVMATSSYALHKVIASITIKMKVVLATGEATGFAALILSRNAVFVQAYQ